MTELIADLPLDDRPRERMYKHGAKTLSDAELLAILLGSGLPGKNAIQVARGLLSEGLRALTQRDAGTLMEIPGVGPAKTARLFAALEISRRIESGEPEDPPEFDAQSLGTKLVATYGRCTQERLGAAFLNSRHRILSEREIFIGTINNALVSTRDIVRHALLEHATAIVVYHNHPSGNPTPSDEDCTFTERLQCSLKLVDLELVDHIIVGAHRFHSMLELGKL